MMDALVRAVAQVWAQQQLPEAASGASVGARLCESAAISLRHEH
jgi:hypothetical protein